MFTPIPGSSLDAKYEGPYEVLERVGSVDYIISTPDKFKNKQLVHVNLLKQYYSRDNPRYVLTARSVENDKKCENLFNTCGHLGTEQLHSLQKLIAEFEDIFSDMPGCTSLIKYRIKLSSEAVPKHCTPCRLSPQKTELLRNEIDKLLKEEIV